MSASDVPSKRQAWGRCAMFPAIIFTTSRARITTWRPHRDKPRERCRGTVTPACNFVFQVSYLAGSQSASAHPCKCQDTQLAQHLVAICPCERCSSNTLIAVCNHAVPAFGSRFAQYFGEGTNIRENLICRHLVISFGTQSSTVAARLQGLRHGNRKNS